MKHSRALKQLSEHSTYECKESLGKGQFSSIGKRKTKNSEKSPKTSRIGKDFQAVLPDFGETSENRNDELIVYPVTMSYLSSVPKY